MTFKFSSVGLFASALFVASHALAQTPDIKQQLEKQGYTFVKQIDAPEGLIGWTGFKEEYPSTVFIAKDQKHYIVGDLFTAEGKNLTEEAIDTHVKSAVLEEVWKSLEKSTWIADGQANAEKIIYVFNDANCPYCHTFWQQARPWVDSGKVQLRHIMVGVIRPSSRGQAATLLQSANPVEAFKVYNQANGKNQIKEMKNIPDDLAQKLEKNEELFNKYGFYATPAIVWKNKQGVIESQQGAPKDLGKLLD